MSRDIDIDFGFSRLPSVREFILALRSRGIVLERGGVLLVSTDGDFTWEDRGVSELNAVVEEMARTVSDGQSVGFKIAWVHQEKRGTIVVMPACNKISFSPDVDTLLRGVDPSSVGVGWYLDELGALLAPFGPTEMTARNVG
ncbi:hypothetical protein GCM10010168_42160 [Actinoplanes ianthinogenes]|uniref:Roadblock/LC7 domain-containing protein n=1 Tax=Actinoplanes ianthinogenes TaxID=122358 RepID=A0ABM7LVW6_9ACTN|nr:hypothetical protein [Actinoplanes ianthinogenes]BCJ43474.1 hypothetical protein Aiant_41310 [Actinoplanes ianthinogenes]GGR19854.1 hypothetical protein GCM10010168_42160 [Actinoplanes ianthinogenes]